MNGILLKIVDIQYMKNLTNVIYKNIINLNERDKNE